jgi:hypothetical protein
VLRERASVRMRRTADLQSVTVGVARSDVGEFRTLSRVYCSRCVRDPATAAATAGCEHGAIALRFRVCVPPSTAWKPTRKHPASATIC